MILASLILFMWNGNCDADIETYNMEEHCGTEINMILDSVYQLKLQLDDVYVFENTITSLNTRSCQTMVEPWYTWPHLMFYFEKLDLDCSLGYLQFFQSKDNETRVQGLEGDICGDQKPKGVFSLEANSKLRVKYVPKRSQYVEEVFSIIVTSYASAPCPVHGFQCDNSRCIDREIRCEGYDSCGDGSGCQFDLSSVAIAGIIVSSCVGLFMLVSMVICIVCCMRKKQKQSRVQTPPQHGVVYTATTNCPVTFSSDSQAYRPNIPGAGSSCAGSNQAPGVPLNVTAGQKPAYPANWTMPPYQASYMRNPPPYEEIQNVTNEENLRSCDNATADEVPDTTDTEGNENEMRVLEEKQEKGNESNIDSISKVDTEDGHQSDAACFIESEDGDTNTRLAPKGETVNNASKELDPQEAEEAVTILENITNELMYQNVSPI